MPRNSNTGPCEKFFRDGRRRAEHLTGVFEQFGGSMVLLSERILKAMACPRVKEFDFMEKREEMGYVGSEL